LQGGWLCVVYRDLAELWGVLLRKAQPTLAIDDVYETVYEVHGSTFRFVCVTILYTSVLSICYCQQRYVQ
jgi:hypothetical protein